MNRLSFTDTSKTDKSIPAEAQVVVGVLSENVQPLMEKFNAFAAELKDEDAFLTQQQYHAEQLRVLRLCKANYRKAV